MIFIGILSTLMVPTEMLVIPWYVLSIKMHWTDSYWGVMFPGVISAFGVFLMRQFFMGVPNDLIDAARLDGFSEFRIFWKIAIPLVKPAIAVALHLHLSRQLERLSLAVDCDPLPIDANAPGWHRLLLERVWRPVLFGDGGRFPGHSPGPRHLCGLPAPDH